MINLSQVLSVCMYALKRCIIASFCHVREAQIITIKPPKQTHYTFMNTAFISDLRGKKLFFFPLKATNHKILAAHHGWIHHRTLGDWPCHNQGLHGPTEQPRLEGAWRTMEPHLPAAGSAAKARPRFVPLHLQILILFHSELLCLGKVSTPANKYRLYNIKESMFH